MMPPLDACKRIMHAWKDAMSTPVSLSSVSLLKGCLLLACIAPCWSCSLKKIATSLPSLAPSPTPSQANAERGKKLVLSACISAFFESCTRPIIPFIVFLLERRWKKDEGRGSGGKFCTAETRKAFVERPSVGKRPSIMGHVFWCCANDMVSRTSSMPPLSRTPTLPPFHLPLGRFADTEYPHAFPSCRNSSNVRRVTFRFYSTTNWWNFREGNND